MTMRVYEIRTQQQLLVIQNLRWCAARNDLSALEYVAVVCNVLYQVEIVGRGDHRLSSSAASHQKIDHLAFALGIERRGGLIQQKNFGIEDQYRS